MPVLTTSPMGSDYQPIDQNAGCCTQKDRTTLGRCCCNSIGGGARIVGTAALAQALNTPPYFLDPLTYLYLALAGAVVDNCLDETLAFCFRQQRINRCLDYRGVVDVTAKTAAAASVGCVVAGPKGAALGALVGGCGSIFHNFVRSKTMPRHPSAPGSCGFRLY